MPHEEPAISVIIPAYGRTDRLRKALCSVLHQNLEPEQYEVLVVDSSPDKRNARMVEELQANARCTLRCLRKEAEGPGPSRNLGAREARGSVLAFIDSDCIASPQWLREGLAAFEDGVGLVQGRTIPEPGVPRTALCAFVWVEQENFIYETANVFYRREAFEQTGGFHADMHVNRDRPVGGEDVDLAWRVKRAGWRSEFAAEALVMHEVVRLSYWRWLCEKRLFIFPRLVRDFPELRRFFFMRCFYNSAHAALVLALAGAALALVSLWFLVLAVPYVALRLFEPTESFRGIRRPLRVAAHFVRDSISVGLLVAGSVYYRTILL